MASGVSFGQTFDCPPNNLASLTRYAPNAAAFKHRHDEAYVAVVLMGSFCQSSLTDRFASTGELVVLPAGSWHSDVVGPSGSMCLNLHVDERDAETLHRSFGKLAPRSWALARQIAREITRDSIPDSLATESLIQEFVTLAHEPDYEPADTARIGSLAEWIASEPVRAWRLSDTAEAVGLHPTHLARSFRHKTGQSLGEFRRAHLMLQLCITLRTSHQPLAEVASEFGFADQAHMTRAFKRHTGSSPGKYRRFFQR